MSLFSLIVGSGEGASNLNGAAHVLRSQATARVSDTVTSCKAQRFTCGTGLRRPFTQDTEHLAEDAWQWDTCCKWECLHSSHQRWGRGSLYLEGESSLTKMGGAGSGGGGIHGHMNCPDCAMSFRVDLRVVCARFLAALHLFWKNTRPEICLQTE